MKTYAGICVGGPMDRKRIGSPDTVARVCKPYNFNPQDPWRDDIDPQEVVLDVFEYRHHEIELHNSSGSAIFGFWIPGDTKGDASLYVIQALASNYVKGL